MCLMISGLGRRHGTEDKNVHGFMIGLHALPTFRLQPFEVSIRRLDPDFV